jgi:hypothetical protein
MKRIIMFLALLALMGIACGRSIERIPTTEGCPDFVQPSGNVEKDSQYANNNEKNGQACSSVGENLVSKAQATAIIAQNAPAIAVSNGIARTWDIFSMMVWAFICGLGILVAWFVVLRINQQVERRNNDSSNGTSIRKR